MRLSYVNPSRFYLARQSYSINYALGLCDRQERPFCGTRGGRELCVRQCPNDPSIKIYMGESDESSVFYVLGLPTAVDVY